MSFVAAKYIDAINQRDAEDAADRAEVEARNQPAPDPGPAPPPPPPKPQLAAQPNTPEADANIEDERKRYRTAGFDQESRLLGGPSGRLGG